MTTLLQMAPRIFISHSHKDNDFGLTLIKDLRQALGDDNAVWYDAKGGLYDGDNWWSRIKEELKARSVFIVILSPDSLTSTWVRDEIDLAWYQKNTPTGKKIIPLLYRECTIPDELALHHIVSFLPPRVYEDAFNELLKALELSVGIETKEVLGKPDDGEEVQELKRPREEHGGLTHLFQASLLPATVPKDTTVLRQPPAASGLIGREEEQAWLKSCIFAKKVVEVSGLGGVGKTALVADTINEVKDQFQGGIAVLQANEIADPVDIVRQLIEKFVPQQQEILSRPNINLDQLYDALRDILNRQSQGDSRVLIVLDNVEPSMIQSEGLLHLCTIFRTVKVSVVMTTRPPISAQLVHEGRELKSFTNEAATALLVRLVEHPLKRVLNDSERRDAAEICDIIGNHAEAIVLIAAYLESNELETLADYLRQLKDQPRIVLNLIDRLQDVKTHKGIRRTFSSSYLRLEAPEQHLFTALGTLAGPGCTYRAILALGAALNQSEDETKANLAVLRRMKLVLEPTFDIHRNMRISFHPLVQEFAREILRTSSEVSQEKLHKALAHHYLQWVRIVDEELLDADDANILDALNWASSRTLQETNTLLAQLVYELRWYWYSRFRFDEAFKWLKAGCDATELLGSEYDEMQAELLYARGTQYQQTGDMLSAEPCYRKSFDLFEELSQKGSPKAGLGEAISGLAALEQQRGDHDRARQYYERSLAIFRDLHNQRGEANALFRLGFLALRTGDTDAAERYYTNSLNIHLKLGDRWGEGIARHALGDVCQQTGEMGKGRAYYEEALAICREVQNLRGEGAVLKSLGDLVLQADGPVQAESHLAQSLKIFRQIFDPQGEGVAMYSMAFLLRQKGEIDRARELYTTSLEIRERVHDERGRGFVLKGLGDLTRRTALRRMDMFAAKKQLEEGFNISKNVKDRRNQGVALKALGDWYWQADDMNTARKSYEDSLVIRQDFNELRGEAIALKALGDLALRERNFANADRRLQRSYQIFVQMKDRRGQGVTKHSLGILAWEHKDNDKARQYFNESLALLKSVQDRQFQGILLYTLALWTDCQRRPRLDDVEQCYHDSLLIATEVQAANNIVLAKEGLGDFLTRRYSKKRQDESKQLLMDAADLYELLGRSQDVQRINEYLKGNKKDYDKDKFIRTLIFDFDEGPNGQGFALSNERRTIDRSL